MYLKVHKSYRNVVALCDEDLIGKKFEEGNRQLDLRENFYKDQEIDSEKALVFLKNQAENDATFNIVGKEATEIALKAEIITQESIDKIQNIPFALTLL